VGVDSAIDEYAGEKLAVVGTPCQMRGISKAVTGKFAEASMKNIIDLKIGLFCMETFNYQQLMDFLLKEGVEASNVDKFEIKRGRFIAQKDGEVIYKTKLSKVKELVRPCCHGCGDFTSEFSDLSIGNVGSPDGWSTVIVRTKHGEQVLMAAERCGLIELQPIKDDDSGRDVIIKLAKIKKKQD
jgi:coenzyme F420 hydrogenase subunit beta